MFRSQCIILQVIIWKTRTSLDYAMLHLERPRCALYNQSISTIGPFPASAYLVSSAELACKQGLQMDIIKSQANLFHKVSSINPARHLGCLCRHPALISTAHLINSSLLTPSRILCCTFLATSTKFAFGLSQRNLINRHLPPVPTCLSHLHSTIAFSKGTWSNWLAAAWTLGQSSLGKYMSPQGM